MADALDTIAANPWMLQPGDRIVETFVEILRAEPTFAEVFGDSIVGYKRMDFGARELPAIRVYNDTGHKEAETWYSGGELTIDVIFPLSARRDDLQKLTDTATSAILSELRRPSVLAKMRDKVPGLNRLGWTTDYDKGLMFQAADEADPVPMTQIVADWRVLLNEWDRYLEGDGRTVDEPFKRTLANLKTLYFNVFGVLDGDTTTEQTTTDVEIDNRDKPPQGD